MEYENEVNSIIDGKPSKVILKNKIIVLPGHNLKITLKRGCFKVNDNLGASVEDVVKTIKVKTGHAPKPANHSYYMVMYEDGTLSNGWQKEK